MEIATLPGTGTMTELEDLRGRPLGWTLSLGRPLRCSVTSGSEEIGVLFEDKGVRCLRARLASIDWRLEHEEHRDKVGFLDSDLTIASARSSFVAPYEATIDGGSRYVFVPTPLDRQAVWFDSENRENLALRRHRHSFLGQSGEIIVDGIATVEHAPILLLLGLARILRKPRLLWGDLGGQN